MRIPFGLQSYVSESLPLSAQRMVNCYLETAPAGAKTPVAVVGTFGQRQFATVADAGAFRGAHVMARVLYVVHGTTLYRVSSGVATALGTVPGSARVSMSTNGTQLAISNGTRMFVYDGTVNEVSDLDFPGSTWVEYLDGYTVFGIPDSGRFGISAINDSTDYNALDFASAESAPDDLIAGIVDHGELFLFGESTFEVWYNSGNSDFPFERTSSGRGEVGIAGRFAVGKKDNTIFFLGSDGIAYRMEGYTQVRISTFGIEHEFLKRDRSECVVETWTERGHPFVCFRFSDGAFVYDVSTQLWHERETYGQSYWSVDFIITAYDKLLAGFEGRVSELAADVYTDIGVPLIASCTAPAIAEGGLFIDHDLLELQFETGVGVLAGQGSEPLVVLDWSDDGGRHFPSTSKRMRSLGRTGQTKKRVRFTRLGRSTDRVYRWSISDPVKRWLLDARFNEHG